MRRFLVVRNWGAISVDQAQQIERRAGEAADADVVWEHSHIVRDGGEVLAYSVYDAVDDDRLAKHTATLPTHDVRAVFELGPDVSPADFVGGR